MESKDVSGHLVSTVPAAALLFPSIPSWVSQICSPSIAVCRTLHPPYRLIIPPSYLSLVHLFLLSSHIYARASLGGQHGTALHQVPCKNPLQPDKGSLRYSAAKHRAHCRDSSPAEETLLKRYLVIKRFSHLQHTNENYAFSTCILFWKRLWKCFGYSGHFSIAKETNMQSDFVCFNWSPVKSWYISKQNILFKDIVPNIKSTFKQGLFWLYYHYIHTSIILISLVAKLLSTLHFLKDGKKQDLKICSALPHIPKPEKSQV